MSRVSHLGVGIALCLFCLVCFGAGCVIFIGMAIGKDSVPGASIFDGDFITLYVVCGGLIVGALWFALLNFKRAFGPSRKEPNNSVPVPDQSPPVSDTASPDEKMAHLIKKPNE